MHSDLIQEVVPNVDNGCTACFSRPGQILPLRARAKQTDRVQWKNWHGGVDHDSSTFRSLYSYDAERVWGPRESERASLSPEKEVVLEESHQTNAESAGVMMNYCLTVLTVPKIQSPECSSHSPTALRRSTTGRGTTPSPSGPIFRR